MISLQAYGSVRRVDIPVLDPCQNPQLISKMGLSIETANACLSAFNRSFKNETEETNSGGFGKITPSGFRPLVLGGNSQNQITSSSLTFTAYVQFFDYAGFAAAMEALRGKKLLYMPPSKNESEAAPVFSAEISVRSKLLFACAQIVSEKYWLTCVIKTSQDRRITHPLKCCK